MLRKFVTLLIVYIGFILQSSVFPHISLGGIVPNVLLIITATTGFMRGQNSGMCVGFISGILIDIFYGSPFGFITLIYILIGYLNGFFKNIFYPEDIKLPMVLIAGSETVYSLLFYIFRFLLRGNLELGYCIIHIILPEMLYTILVTMVMYKLIVFINEQLEIYERRNS